jgi:4-oxalocrotonate tautomerase family enzyme
MAQVKIYGLREYLAPVRGQLSTIIHSCVVDALAFPEDKRVHRFLLLDREDFIFTLGRSERYTIIEISMFEGRSTETKKQLLRLLMDRISSGLGMHVDDIEITIFETPRQNWGIRGLPADELQLSYKVEK